MVYETLIAGTRYRVDAPSWLLAQRLSPLPCRREGAEYVPDALLENDQFIVINPAQETFALSVSEI